MRRAGGTVEWDADALFYAATLEVTVAAQPAFEYLADGLRQGDWTLGSWNRRALGSGLFAGTSLFDGGDVYVRIHADRERLLVDYEVGPSPERLFRTNSARVVPGEVLGRAPGTCLITLMRWRARDQSNELWRRACASFEAEIHIIKGRLELGF